MIEEMFKTLLDLENLDQQTFKNKYQELVITPNYDIKIEDLKCLEGDALNSIIALGLTAVFERIR